MSYRRFAVLLLLFASGVAAPAPAGWSSLLEPEGLSAILQRQPEVRVIQVSGNFAEGHIPGSQESDYADWRGAGENPGELRDLEEYGVLLRKLGISVDTPVVVIHAGADPTDMGAATRVYWTLKSLGVLDVAVVNGGLLAWRRAGLPTTGSRRAVTVSDYRPEWHDDWRVTTEQVAALVESGDAALIDARPGSFFRGFRATVGSPGTIRGARSLEFDDWFAGNTLRPTVELAAILEAHGNPAGPVTVSFCNTGHWASINWFVMSELLGVNNTRLYAESIGAWSAEALPMDNRPNRGAVYRELTVQWLRSLFGVQEPL